ncbi:MAG: DNA mismatch repair endonuclease MutL [Chlamydiales bacterium]
MKRPIAILDEQTINQIAAGEVIENSSSVVKELIDNSIDSGASAISVQTLGGGRGLIRVVDDGVGMDEKEILLALQRHATSKIKTADDLCSLSSLGFRGEALPSIASIAKMRIHSCHTRGTQVEVEGGKVTDILPSPRVQGTSIEVRSLFYNVPVRKKFQKCIAHDNAQIHKILIQAALGNSSLRFKWENEKGEQLLVEKDDGIREQKILGEEFSCKVEARQKEWRVAGFLAPASYHRPSRSGQHLFVNGRCITCSFISQKVLDGYATRLPQRRFPCFVLYLTLPPSLIDVNVHPQKREIRFRDKEQIGEFVRASVDRALQERPVLFYRREKSLSIGLPELFEEEPTSYPKSSYRLDAGSLSIERLPRLHEKELPSYHARAPLTFLPQIHPLSIVGKFLLFADGQNVWVADIPAIQQLFFYQQLARKEKPEVQKLLMPIHLELFGVEKRLLLEAQEQLEFWGIEIRPFGGDTFVVEALPPFLDTDNLAATLLELIRNGTDPQTLRRLPKKSCFTIEEAVLLVRRIYEGQPQAGVIIQITESSLGKIIR